MRDPKQGRRIRYNRKRDSGLFVLLFVGGAAVPGFWMIHPLLGVLVGVGFIWWYADHMDNARRKRKKDRAAAEQRGR